MAGLMVKVAARYLL